MSDQSPYQSPARKGSHTITEILPSLFFVHRGFLNGNHFVYRSDRPVLIDTAYLSHFDRTCQLIADLGADVSRTALIVSTHTHCDHIGGNRRIQELSGCGIALHTIGRHFIMNTVWFPETCAFFFNGEHRRKFDEVMAGLIRRRIVTCTDGKLFTQVAA